MGKASLDSALGTTSSLYDVRVEWKPFFLRPNMPSGGTPLGSTRPDGSKVPSGPYWHYAIDRARELGIDMSGSVGGGKFPNTTLAHVLLSWAWEQAPERQHQLAELIFQAFYSRAVFLDLPALVALAEQAGYDPAAAHLWLLSTRGEAAVKAEATQSGVSGVPYFIINGKGVFSGAQEPSSFIQEFAKAVRERPLPPRAPRIHSASALATMSPKELKTILLNQGANPITVAEYVEKQELASAVGEMQRAGLLARSPTELKAMLVEQGIHPQACGAEKADLVNALLGEDAPHGQ